VSYIYIYIYVHQFRHDHIAMLYNLKWIHTESIYLILRHITVAE